MEILLLLLIIGGAYWLGTKSKKATPQQPQPRVGFTPSQSFRPQFARNDKLINQKRAELKDIKLSDEQQKLFEKLERVLPS